MVYHHPVRRNLTSCGTFWHAETDAAVIANPVIALLLHCARGVALFGLVEAFVGNVRESPQPCHLPPRTYPIPSDHRSASCRSFLHCCECNLSPHATKLVTGTSGTQRVLRAASTRRFRAYLFSHPSSSFCYADTENKTGAVHGLSHVDPTAPQSESTERLPLCAASSPSRPGEHERCLDSPFLARADHHYRRSRQTTTVAAGFAGHVAWVVAGWLIKKGLSQVQDLVVDLDEDGILATSPAKKRDKVE